MPVPVAMPKQGNTVVECLLVDWRVKEGDVVEAGAPLCSIETDKASFEVEAPVAGTVLKLFRNAGDLVPVLTNIAAIGAPGEDVSGLAPEGASAAPAPAAAPTPSVPVSAPTAAPKPSASAIAPTPAPVPVPTGGRAAVSPRARKLADELAIDAAALAGSGPGGRVVSTDVRAAADARGTLTPAARDAARAGLAPTAATGLGGRVRVADMGAPVEEQLPTEWDEPPTEIPYRGIRKLIGERMRESLTRHAQLTLNRGADARQLLAARALFKAGAEAAGLPKLTVNDLVCWVVARTLPEFPEVNGIFDFDRETFVQYRQAHLGVAIDTPRGLMVPVIRDAHRMGLAEFSTTLAGLAAAAKKGAIDPDCLQGGTFTVTNLGALGIESFTPVLNSPQVAILGVCAVKDEPVRAAAGGVELRPTMGLSLTIDHQLVDGAPGARFLKAVAEALAGVLDRLALRGVR